MSRLTTLTTKREDQRTVDHLAYLKVYNTYGQETASFICFYISSLQHGDKDLCHLDSLNY